MVVVGVLILFALFITADYLYIRHKRKKEILAASPSESTSVMFNKQSIRIPDNLILTKNHTWLEKITDGNVKIGMDNFLQHALGKVNISPLKKIGDFVNRGEVLFKAKFNNKSVLIESPISGTVMDFNVSLYKKELDDVYDTDWVAVIFPEGKSFEVNVIDTTKEAMEWLTQEFKELKDFVAAKSAQPELAGVTMQDGGNIIEGVISYLDEEVIKEFEIKFLRN